MARGSSSQLRVSFVVDTGGLRSGFGRATKETDRFGRSTNQTSRSTGRLGVNLGRAAVAAAGAAAAFVPLSLAISQAARSTIEFDRSMRNVNSIAQLSEGQFQGLSKSVLELAGPTAQAPRTLADGLYDLVSSGFDSKEALDVLEVSAKAATAGLTETEVASKTVAAALNAYRLPAKRASVISDILFRTVDRGVISFEQLSSDIGDVLPFASSLGVGLEEVGASVATMTKAGIGSAETMTRVKNVMVTLLKPGDDLSAAMRSLGYDSGEAMIQAEGFQGTLDALIGATDGSKNAVAQLFPNIRALGGVLALTGENSRGAAKDLAGMRDAAGATDRALSQQSQSIYFQWQRLKATAEAMAIEFGTTLVPSIREVLEVLNDDSLTSAEKFSEMRKRIVNAVRQIAPQVAQAAGEVGVILATSMAKAFADTGILGKLAVTAFFVRMFGGPRAVIGAGVAVGGLFSKGMAGAMAVGSMTSGTFGLARSFGRGVITSAVAGIGAGGALIARGLFASIARAIPVVGAAFAIGDIVMSVVAGDMKSAGIKAGGGAVGAIAGGIVGSIVPGIGTAIGAAVGGGLGVAGASIIQGIVDGAEEEAPRQRSRIEVAVRRLATYAEREADAYRRLARSSRFVSDERKRQVAAASRVQAAERNLVAMRQRFGAGSDQAAAAERRLARAINASTQATKRAQVAERVHGTERKATRLIIRQNVKSQKVEVEELKRKERAARRAFLQDQDNIELARRYRTVAGRTRAAQRRLNESYEEAGQKIGPKFEASLRKIDGAAIALRRRIIPNLRQLPPIQEDVGNSAEEGFRQAQDFFGEYAQSLSRRSRRVNSNMRSMPRVQDTATDEMLEDLRDSLGVMGNLGTPQARRGGGRMTGPGGTVLAAVSPGELISHKGREIYVPGKPEPRDSVLMNLPVGAKVFTYDGQARLAAGASHTQALRDQAPHFATGGIVRPKITGGSPMANRAANQGIGIVHRRAEQVYRENMVSDLDSAVRLASRFGLDVSSGLRIGDDGYHGVDRARDFVGSASEMFSFAKFIGTRFGHKLLELIYSPLGWSIKNGARTAPYAVADHYDHVHVAMRKGGIIPAFRKGGNINRIWREHNSGYGDWGGPTLPSYVVAALAQAAGMPGRTMEQVTRGESGAHKKNSARPGATGIDPGGTKGHGLWMITSGYNEDLARRAGGWRRMLNPVVNAWAAAQIYRRQGLGAWYGDGSVTADGLNYRGKYDIRNSLGGLSFQGALYRATGGRLGEKPKAIGQIVKSSGRLIGRNDATRARLSGPGARRARGLLKRADALARRAAKAAKAGNVTRARELMKRANALRGRAVGMGGQGGGNQGGGGNRPVGGDVGYLLRLARNARGATKESLLSSALSIAQETEETEDDKRVLNAQRNLQEGRVEYWKKKLAQANRNLKKKGLSKKERRKYREQRRKALEALGLATAEISSIDSQLGDLGGGGGDSETDLATAMADLAEAIKEQNRLQSSVQATSSREALRMLSDVISGQIVGKRLPVGQTPTGVRY